MEIAESIIHGLAQYSEIDVKIIDIDKTAEQKNYKVDKELLGLCI